jgi:hypothetical protein
MMVSTIEFLAPFSTEDEKKDSVQEGPSHSPALQSQRVDNELRTMMTSPQEGRTYNHDSNGSTGETVLRSNSVVVWPGDTARLADDRSI